METHNKNITTISEHGVLLPCDHDHLGEFVSSLLKSKPQRLEKFIFGHYEVSEQDILNFHYLLDQRIKQQNQATLTGITFTVIYDDDSSYVVHSLKEFQNRAEIEAKRSVAINIEWTYLVKFEDRDISEKQTIEVSIVTNDESGSIAEVEDGILRVRRFPRLKQGYICIRVSHTAKTWGHDIESLLIKHAKKLIINENAFRKFIYRRSGLIATAVFLLLIGAAFTNTSFNTKKQIASMQRSVAALKTDGLSEQDLLQRKIDFVLDNTANGVWHKHYNDNNTMLGVSCAIALILSLWVAESADNRPKSYILLTEEAVKYKNKMKSNANKKWLSFVGAMMASVAAGVFSNFLYAYITG